MQNAFQTKKQNEVGHLVGRKQSTSQHIHDKILKLLHFMERVKRSASKLSIKLWQQNQ
jgi:hypothetical protein